MATPGTLKQGGSLRHALLEIGFHAGLDFESGHFKNHRVFLFLTSALSDLPLCVACQGLLTIPAGVPRRDCQQTLVCAEDDFSLAASRRCRRMKSAAASRCFLSYISISVRCSW